MENQTLQWILWAVVMVIFLALTLTGHTTVLGLAITAVAIFWYSLVPQARSRRQ
jgi:membrane protein implicated in regulation of membrane protease activity